MPSRIEEFWASARAQDHMLTKHGVSLDDAVEAAESAPVFQRARDSSDGERRYLAVGKTASGRRLWVIFADEGNGRGRIITAREPRGRDERSRHRRLRGD